MFSFTGWLFCRMIWYEAVPRYFMLARELHGAASPRKAECVTRMFFEAFTSSPGKPPNTVT
jgi:hypothetical protein